MIFKQVKTDMEFLGTYKKEFDPIIKVYVDTHNHYTKAWRNFKKAGMPNTVECAGGLKKNPELIVIDELRKQLATLSDKLGLNPKALDQIKNAQIPQEQSALSQFLSEFDGKDNGRD